VVARVLGKTVGISLACFLAVRLGIARLPSGTSRRHVLGAAAAAGVPFTVSLFIAEIALPAGQLQAAKVGIVVAGALSSLLGFALLRRAARGE
jgi:NhaA family Na+:H+ antiporter